MTIIAQLNFDSMTDGSNIALSAPWSVPSSATIPVASSAAKDHGTLGARWASTSAYGRIDYDFSPAPITSARVASAYFNIRTFATTNHYIASMTDNHTSGAIQADWRVNTAHTVTLRNITTAVSTSTATLSANTWYRYEWRFDPVAHNQELKIFAGESITALIDLAGTFSSTTAGIVAFGPYVAASGGAIDYDTVKIADDWVGPQVSLPVITNSVTNLSQITAVGSSGSGPYIYAISQVSGTITAPTLIRAGVWTVPTPQSGNLVYAVTITDSANNTSTSNVTVSPATAASVWPKRPSPVGTNTWF